MMTHMPAPVLRTSHHVLASLPFLLGFQPQSSAVLLWLREGRLILTQRIDLPELSIKGNDFSTLDVWTTGVVESASHADSQEVLIAIFPTVLTKSSGVDSHQAQDCGPISNAPLVASLSRALVTAGKYPCAAWLVIEDDFWEFDFASANFSPTCHTVDPQVLIEVADDFVSAGWGHLSNRQEVLSEFDADPVAQILMLTEINHQKKVVRAGEQEVKRDECISIIVAFLEAGTTDPSAQAQMITGLMDIRVRDCVLWQLTNQNCLASCAETLRMALRATPAGFRAPLATVTALAFWLQGDGVRAGAALKQATIDKADYGLAQLLDLALINGLAPKTWNETMGKMPYEACRAIAASQLQ